MADLKQSTTIGGSTIWNQANLLVQPSGNSISYRGFKVYTENDKPTPDDVGAVSRTGDTMTGSLNGTAAYMSNEISVGYRLNMVRNAGFYPYITMARSDNPLETLPTSEITVGRIETKNTAADSNPASGQALSLYATTRQTSGGGILYLAAYNNAAGIGGRIRISGDDAEVRIQNGAFKADGISTLVGATQLNSTLKVNGVSTLAAINASGAVALTNTLSVQGQTQLTGGLMTTTLSTTSTIDSSGELIVRQANLIRGISGTIGFIIRSDTAKTYLLHTAAGAQEGTWNAARPLTIDKASGQVQIGNSLSGNSLTVVGGQAVDTVSVSGVTNLGGMTNLATTSGSWIDMRTQIALSSAAVNTSSASALVRQEHANYHFVLGGLGNSAFGIYKIDKSRTTNGTDGGAYLRADGAWVSNGQMIPADYGNFDSRYSRTGTGSSFDSVTATGGNMYIKGGGNTVLWMQNNAGAEKTVLYAEANNTFNIRVNGDKNFQFTNDGFFSAPSGIRSGGNGVLYGDGNLSGGIWSSMGYQYASLAVQYGIDRSNDAWNKAQDAQVNRVQWVRWGATNNFGPLGQTANQRIIDNGWVLVGLNGTGGQQNNSINLIGGRIQVYKDNGGWMDSVS